MLSYCIQFEPTIRDYIMFMNSGNYKLEWERILFPRAINGTMEKHEFVVRFFSMEKKQYG